MILMNSLAFAGQAAQQVIVPKGNTITVEYGGTLDISGHTESKPLELGGTIEVFGTLNVGTASVVGHNGIYGSIETGTQLIQDSEATEKYSQLAETVYSLSPGGEIVGGDNIDPQIDVCDKPCDLEKYPEIMANPENMLLLKRRKGSDRIVNCTTFRDPFSAKLSSALDDDANEEPVDIHVFSKSATQVFDFDSSNYDGTIVLHDGVTLYAMSETKDTIVLPKKMKVVDNSIGALVIYTDSVLPENGLIDFSQSGGVMIDNGHTLVISKGATLKC